MHTDERSGSGNLQVAENLPLQQKIWKAERISWAIVISLLFAALLGLFGKGPLSSAESRTPDGLLRVEYDRLSRYQAPTELKLHIGPAATQSESLRLWINADYWEQVELSQISPAPQFTEMGNNKHIYHFKIATPNSPLLISFQVKGAGYGKTDLHLGLQNGPALNMKQFFYP